MRHKRIGQLATMVGAISLLSLLTVGCGSGDSLSAVGGGGSLTGTWLLSALQNSGRLVTCPNDLVVDGIRVDACVTGETLVLRDDRTYTQTFPPDKFGKLTVVNGTYSTSGGRVTFKSLTSGFDSDGDGIIGAGETTALSPVTDPNNVPASPQQRFVADVVVTVTEMTVTQIAFPTTEASGLPVVNSDGTVNAPVTSAQMVYARQ